MVRRIFCVFLLVALTTCEERSTMAGATSKPPTGTMSGHAGGNDKPSADELRRQCLEIAERISPVGQPLTPEDERLAGMVERPGQQRVAIAYLGRPHVAVDARGIILEKRCY
jgi:hypothetical protein